MYTTSESEGVVELTVAVLYPQSGRAPKPFTVLTSTEDGTAGIIRYRNSKLTNYPAKYLQLFFVFMHITFLLNIIYLPMLPTSQRFIRHSLYSIIMHFQDERASLENISFKIHIIYELQVLNMLFEYSHSV